MGLIRKGAEHLNECLLQVHDLAKVEAGAMTLQREAAALHQLLHGNVGFIALLASGKGLGLALQFTEGQGARFTLPLRSA